MSVTVRIDRLVLDGLDLAPGHPQRLRTSLESELARLLALPKASGMAGGATPHLRTHDVPMRRDVSPEAIGRHVARAVHRRLGETR